MNGMNKKWMAGCWMMLLVGIMASCASGDNYESALPKDAALVVSVNLASMAEKAGWQEKKVRRLYRSWVML